jgi:SAM-dependent methyltransferase
MSVIPWRVRNFISEHFPLLYHFAANVGFRGNSVVHWDARLAATWNDATRHWPTKARLIASLTKSSDAVLDVGCGNGSILRYLRGQGYAHLHGLEISQYAIRRLRSEGIEMHYGLLPEIPLPDSTFDVVIASQVLEHIVRRAKFLKEIRRVMKPQAKALIFVPDDCLGPISEREHVIKFNACTLRKLLERHFSVVSLRSMRDENYEMPILFAHVERASEASPNAPHLEAENR